jgi:predicted transcriptional regulator YheO
LTNKPTKNNTSSSHRKNKRNKAEELVKSRELDQQEELSIRIDTLVELLSEKGIINKKNYINNVMMRIHETSKAKSFDECDEI